MADERMPTRMEMVQAYTPPHCEALGITIAEIEPDRCVMAMPFKPELVTVGDVVHGGAISTLIDMAVTVSAWATDEVPESPSGSTVSLTVNFASAARGVDLRAEGRVLRRGRRLLLVRGARPRPRRQARRPRDRDVQPRLRPARRR